MVEEKFKASGKTFNITINPGPGDGRKYPMLLVLHGNVGLNLQYGPRIKKLAEDFSKSRYVTAVPEYYENNTGNEKDEAVTPQKLATLAAAIKHVAARKDADPNRIGLIGYSLGAAIAMNYLATDVSGRVKVLVDFFGPVRPFFSEPPIPPPISTGIGNFPPTITFHDAKDLVVPASRSRELHALFPGTIDHKLKIYSTEPRSPPNHVFREGKHADTDSIERAKGWVGKYLPPTGV